VRVSALTICWLDEDTGVWSRLPSSAVDTVARTVSARLHHFSVYALMANPEYDLANVRAYPVPYKPSRNANGIRFDGLSSAGTIKIYTLDGDLVKTIPFSDSNGGFVVWNPVVNESGDPLASDVYVYVVENPEQKKTGKIMVVR
jgi:hypothetical protein